MRTIIFWLNRYPRSITGMIQHLSDQAGYKVICVCYYKDIDEDRKKMGWNEDELNKVEFIYLNESNRPELIIKKLLNENANLVHIYGGPRGGSKISKFVNNYVIANRNLDSKIIIISERPYYYNKNAFKRFVLKFIYKLYYHKINESIDAYLIMGEEGVKELKKIGWDDNKVFNYLYHKKYNIESDYLCSKTDIKKILYIGQFDTRKGVDILLDVFEKIDPNKLELYLVGMNGNLYDEVLDRISYSKGNIKYLGVWNSKQIETEICKYDLCVVPSRFDGWGMFTMEALLAGVGVITTTETGSKDLVYASNAGIVVKSGDYKSLLDVFLKIQEDPSTLNEWKAKAKSYIPKISDDSIGNYVLNILDFIDNPTMEKPTCPWTYLL